MLTLLASRRVAMWRLECGYKMPAVFHCSSAGWKVYGSYKFSEWRSWNVFVRFKLLSSSLKWPFWVEPDFKNHGFICSYGGGPRFGGNRGGGGGKFGNPGDRLRKKQWNLDELPKFEKNFYQQHPDVARRSMVRSRLVRQCYATLTEMCSFLHVSVMQSVIMTELAAFFFFFLQLSARGWTVQKGKNHYSQGKRMPKPHHKVSRGQLSMWV